MSTLNAAPASRAAARALLVLTVVCLGLAAACVLLWRQNQESAEAPARIDPTLEDEEVRRRAVQELVSRGTGGWDSFADPDVGRLLQPGMQNQELGGLHFSTNRFGLREREYALPKPAGVVRVVLLGDSFVMGDGVEAADRLGVFLEEFLQERAQGPHGPIECLHVGLDNWNTLAETAFVRRQLGVLQPDLVVQILIRNDLEDNVGARGFGAMANFDPLHGERGDGIFRAKFPVFAFGTRQTNWLAHGLDWESRTRFELAAAAVVELAHRIEQRGGRFLLVDNYSGLLPAAKRFITSRLADGQSLHFPTSFTRDERYRVSSDNAHWNRAGHELVARILYAAIAGRGLLPALALPPWPEAAGLLAQYDDAARTEADEAFEPDPGAARRRIREGIDFQQLDDDAAAQVHGGVMRGGLLAPYAAIILRGAGRSRLRVVGRGLPRAELAGAHLLVFIEEAQVGRIDLAADREVDATFDVPPEVAGRPFVTARFAASDYVYGGPDLRHHICFDLDRVELGKP